MRAWHKSGKKLSPEPVLPRSIKPYATIRTQEYSFLNICKQHALTHLPLEKMAAILQTIFSDAFPWMKNPVFLLKFHWILLLRVQLPSIGLDNCLALNRCQAIIWTNADRIHWWIYATLGGDELILFWLMKNLLTFTLIWFIIWCECRWLGSESRVSALLTLSVTYIDRLIRVEFLSILWYFDLVSFFAENTHLSFFLFSLHQSKS